VIPNISETCPSAPLYNRLSSIQSVRVRFQGEHSLRVLHVTPYGPEAWAYGGIPRIAGALARGLARRGHEVTVCTTDAHDGRSRLASRRDNTADDGVAVRVFPNVSNRLAYRYQAFMPVGLSSFLETNAGAFDIAHLHACRNAPGAIAAYHLTRAGVPYVLAPNGTAPVIERRFLAKRLFDALAGDRIVRSAARVLAVSDAETKQLTALGVGGSSIEVVPNPIDLDEFDPPIERGRFRNRFGITEDRIVLFLGKITPRKRVDMLIRAFAQLVRTDARLVIAGNDLDGDARLKPSRYKYVGITFTGLLTGRERLEALADADVVVYPGEHEIFGLVPLESILCGTPVVVSDDCGCGEVVRSVEGGLAVPGQAGALAGAISEVLDNPAYWRSAAAQAAARVRATYGADDVCGRLERVYEEILE
jgi:glycosyltransferase involved in cell wall biosynthesis